MGECAEGPHVDIGILPMLLNAYAEIVMLDRNEHVPLIKKGGWEEGMEPRRYQVSLLFRPGHYDLLYRQQFVSAVAALEPAMVVTPTSRPSTPSDALPPGTLLRRHSRSTDGESYDRTSPAPTASAAAAGLPRAPSPHLLAPNSPALGAVAGGTPSRTGSIAGGIVGVAVTPLSLPAAASATTVAVTNANGTAADSGGIAATTSVSGTSVRERDFARALTEAQKKDSTLKLPKMVERAQMLVDMELHIPFIFEAWFTHKPKNENEWLTNYFMIEEAHGGVPVNEILSSSSAVNDNDNDDANNNNSSNNNNKTANGSDASVVSTATTTATAATATRPKAPATKDKLEGLSEDDRRLVKEYEGRMTPYQRNHAMEAIVHVRLHTKFPMPLILHAVVTKGVIEKAALIRACDEAWRKEREEQAKQQQQQQQPSPPLPPSAEVSDATVVKPPLPPSLPSTAAATPLSLASGVDPEEQGWLRKVEEAAPTFIKEKAKTNVKLMLRDGDFPPALILEAVVVGKQYTCAGIQQYCETAEANATARTAPAPPAAPAAAVSVLPPPPPTATEERRTSSVTQQQQQASGTTETAKFSAQYASESMGIVKPVAQHQIASSLPPSTQQQPQSQQQAPSQPRVPTPPFLPPLDEELPAIDPTDTILEQGNLTASEEKKIMLIRAKVPVDQWTAALRELVAVYVAGPFDLDLVLDAVVTGQCYAAAEIRVFCHNATETEKANKQRRLQSLRVDVAAPVELPAAVLTPPVAQPSPSSSSGGVRATLPPQTVRTVMDADSYSSTSNGGGGGAAKASPKSLAQRYSEISQSMKAPLSPPPPSSQTSSSSSSSLSPNAAPVHSTGSKAATDADQVPPTTNPMLLKRAASGLPSPHTSAAPSPRAASPVVRAASSPALQQPPLPPVSSTPKRLSRHELCEISDKFHFSRLYQQYERLVDVFHFANDHAIAAIVTFSCFNLRAAIRCIRFSERHEILRKSTLMPIGDDDADDAVVVAVYQQGRAQGIERGMLLDAIGYEHVTQVAEVNEAYARYVSRSDTVTSSHNSSTNSLQNLVQKTSAPTPASPLASPLATAAATAAAAAAASAATTAAESTAAAIAPLAAATSPMSGGIASLAHNRSAMRPRPTPLQPELVGNNLQASPLRSRSNAPSTTPTPTSSSAAAPPTPSQTTPSARGATTAAAATPVPAPVSASTTPTTQPRPIVIGSRPSLSRTPSSAAATPVATPTSTPNAAGRRASTGATATASGSSKVTRTESPHKRTVSIAIVGSRPGKITTASTGLPATANAAAVATTANEATTTPVTTATASGSIKTPAVATTGSSKLTPTATPTTTLRRSSTATRPTSTASTPTATATATTAAVPTTPGASTAAASTTPTTGSSSRMLRVPFEEERDDIWKRLKEDKLKTLDRVQAQDWLKYHGLWDERSMRAKSVIDLRDILVKFKRTPKLVARTTATGGAAATTPTTTTTRR